MDAQRLRAAKDLFAARNRSKEGNDVLLKLWAFTAGANKMNFPYYDELPRHLEYLNLQELSRCMTWIPFERFTNVRRLGRGGFATVHRGTIKWKRGQYTDHVVYSGGKILYHKIDLPITKYFALKEITPDMAPERAHSLPHPLLDSRGILQTTST
ncbi:hypothetical protein BC938DRAFT_477740 [Jimgerdemannia flammicorona]|uniref:Protein kinase domain-containing protein n=1 Tax=Jimgerdemannia flammicorona TaxID=994334 RepID=A0A433QNW9_9FUNG|nr:hypothetical protein BC938DRAFT_477740 [Jimgerdemannia flammicorona]